MNAQQINRWLEMANATLKKSLSGQVRAKVESGKCLLCDSPHAKRGLCNAHYLKFNRALNELPIRERADFEVQMVREGKIVAARGVSEILNPNPFKVA